MMGGADKNGHWDKNGHCQVVIIVIGKCEADDNGQCVDPSQQQRAFSPEQHTRGRYLDGQPPLLLAARAKDARAVAAHVGACNRLGLTLLGPCGFLPAMVP